MNIITFQDLQDALNHIKRVAAESYVEGDSGGIGFPYDMFPGTYGGGAYQLITRGEWESYQWNPPQWLYQYKVPQDGAMPKPTWDEILEAIEPGYLYRVKPQLVRGFSDECKRRICQAYGESNAVDEIFSRLRGNVLGDVERERLRERYAVIKEWISGVQSKAELEIVNPNSDEYWVEEWSAPE